MKHLGRRIGFMICVTFGLACAQLDGPAPARAGEVRIAVPAQDDAQATILWSGRDFKVRFLEGTLAMQCSAHRILVDGVWGVVWTMDEKNRVRVQDAIREHGEAWLVFEGRPFAWSYERIGSRGTFMNWPSLSEESATELARRVSSSGN